MSSSTYPERYIRFIEAQRTVCQKQLESWIADNEAHAAATAPRPDNDDFMECCAILLATHEYVCSPSVYREVISREDEHVMEAQKALGASLIPVAHDQPIAWPWWRRLAAWFGITT